MSLCADDGIGAKVWIFGFDRISEKVAWLSAKTEWGKEPSSCSAVTRWWVFSLRVTSAFRIKVPIFFLCWDNTGLVLWVWSLFFFYSLWSVHSAIWCILIGSLWLGHSRAFFSAHLHLYQLFIIIDDVSVWIFPHLPNATPNFIWSHNNPKVTEVTG